jgi:Carboxypeptidase regulatory-like domain
MLVLVSWARAEASAVRITVEVADHQKAAAVEVRITLAPQPAADGSTQPIEVQLEAPAQTAVDLPPGRPWQLRAEAPGYWAPPALVLVRGEPATASVTLFPTGTLSGELTLPDQHQVPAHLSVRFSAAPLAQGTEARSGRPALPPAGSQACALAGLKWRCEVPAGLLDLRLRAADDLAPVYLWGLSVKPGERRDLGRVALKAGASVVGWVETAPEGLPIEGARVSLSPESAAVPTDPATLERLRALDLATSTNARGFFQILGVTAGTYHVSVKKAGLAPAEISSVDVLPGLESEISQPIVLAAPGTVGIAAEPPVDPYGRPWRIRLFSLAEPHGRPAASLVVEPSGAGQWSRSGLAPGSYELVVSDDEDERWVSEEISVVSGEQQQFVTVPLLEVHGTVSMGGDTVTGTLWLGSQDGERRCRFAVDLEGEFEGFLPGEGVWPAEFLIEDERGVLRLSLDPVTVERRAGKSDAEVAIEIPNTRLAGEVVDSSGRPVAGAQVLVHFEPGKRQPSRRDSDGDGRFLFRGLPEGQVTVVARLGDETSDWVPVSLAEDLESPDLRLTLRSNRTITGRTLTGAGPLPGAEVVLWPQLTGPGGGRIVQVVSGPDGTFKATVPADTVGLTLLARAPSYATRLFSIPLNEHDLEPVEVPFDSLEGTLVIDFGAAGATGVDGPAPLLVAGNAFALLPLLAHFLRPEAGSQGGDHRLTFDAMEAGTYSLCVGGAAVAAMMQGKMAPDAGCASGFLAPMGELVLHLPTSRQSPP